MTSELFGISQKNLALIITALKSFPQITEALVFGSRAMGNFKQGSDIDIALKGEIDLQLLAKIKGYLEEEIATPYLFDVVSYDSLENENLIKHIDKHGILLYKS